MLTRIIAVIFALFAALFAYLYAQERARKPTDIVHEVERKVEVPKEVIREVKIDVPREVIKEVPVEVVREIEKPLSESQAFAIELGSRIVSAKQALSNEDVLAGVDAVRVDVRLSDDVKRVVGEEVARNRVELILRRNGLKIDSESTDVAFFIFDGFWDDRKNMMTYNVSHGVRSSMFLARDGRFIVVPANCWVNGYFGHAGSQKIEGALLKNVESSAEAVANALLSARDKE